MGFLPLVLLVPPSIADTPVGIPGSGELAPYALRCESLADPEGIGRPRPELSWKLRATKAGLRGLRQTAYEVRVGSSSGNDDLWRSGKVASSAQYGVEFGGRPLQSGQVVYWSVRTWDQNGLPSEWSAPARFSVGLLSEGDWKARWIGWEGPDSPDPRAKQFDGASWIWSSDEADALRAAKGRRSFLRTIDLATKPSKATVVLTADDRFTLSVNGTPVYRSADEVDGWRNPVSIDLSPHLVKGENIVRVDAENTSEGPAGVLARLVVDGGPTVVTDDHWLSDGQPAKLVAPYGSGPWGRFADSKILRPSTLYTRTVRMNRKPVRAMAHVTALGLVDLSINGKRVADDRFTPGWTDYKKRVYARTYDVTKALRSGDNALTLEVGDGWYSGYVGYSRQRAHYGDRPLVRAQIDLEYADGTRQTIGTDESWRARAGDTVSQDFLAGEEYDARKPDRPSGRPFLAKGIETPIEPFPGVPVLPYDRRRPKAIHTDRDGYILDFGQNLAGFAHLKAKGVKGQRIELQFVEALNPDGTPYTANLRSARATDAYTFRGQGIEEWEPRFTFHGFRYLRVTGLGRKPTSEEITAVAISSATPETGRFECSDPMLNRLATNAWWTQKMNFIDVPTDCPQRDERLGWTGDAQAYVRTAATYSDVQAFFRKWLVALDDDQGEDGNYPKIAPKIMGESDGGPAWSDAGVICPWTIYSVYGDKRLLSEHYPAMRRFVEFSVARSTPDLLPPARYHCFGDWLSINADTPSDVIYEAYFAYSTGLLADAAETLGYADDAKRYRDLHARIKDAFMKAYVSDDGTVKGDTQTAYVLALGFDLIPVEAVRQRAAKRLVDNIQARNWHLSTGFVGTRDLMRVLTEIGRSDVAFRLLHNKTFPSWGFEIANGATTIWERWDGWTPDKGFQDPGMNSFAHYAYGAVMGWVFQTIGGIDLAEPGFAKIRIAPKVDPNLTWARAAFESVRGPVRTEWRKADGKLVVTVEVPPNAVAEVRLPGGTTETIGSGSYRYTTELK